jgi:hypothetical protein
MDRERAIQFVAKELRELNKRQNEYWEILIAIDMTDEERAYVLQVMGS